MNYEIVSLKSLSDNYIWVIYNHAEAIVVDPGTSQVVIDFLHKHNLKLSTILLTHTHADHNGGVNSLISKYPNVNVYDNLSNQLSDREVLNIKGFPIFEVITTPGHVDEHVCYLFDSKHLFCGDTLFSLGCGRVFTGDYIAAFTSLEKLKQLNPDTLCYPAHEYTANNLRFTTQLDSNHLYYKDLAAYLLMKLSTHGNSLPTTLENELKYNLFLRCNDPAVQDLIAKETGTVISDELTCFIQLRQLRNNF